MFVLIAGVNVHNEYYVNRIAGIAGYAGRAVEFINERPEAKKSRRE